MSRRNTDTVYQIVHVITCDAFYNLTIIIIIYLLIIYLIIIIINYNLFFNYYLFNYYYDLFNERCIYMQKIKIIFNNGNNSIFQVFSHSTLSSP